MHSLKKYDYIIVGAGLYGLTFAYLANRRGKRCLLLDKRKHIGGNLYCRENNGIIIHSFGAHIFHTSDKEIWNFVNKLTPFRPFKNSPLANYNGEIYNLPFNMNTFHQLWGVVTPNEAKKKIQEDTQFIRKKLQLNGDDAIENLEEQALCLVGRDLYEKLIKGYTEKQWGRPCNELPPSIIRRIPLRFTYDNNYFNDFFQGIPYGGYNRLTEALARNIEVRTEVDFLKDRNFWISQTKKIVYTGAIDAYYDYCYGALDYRSLFFEEETLEIPDYQGNAVVNYTSNNIPYTRIIEHKHFSMSFSEIKDTNHTIISKEYPIEWKEGYEPYYPIRNKRNMLLYQRYEELSQKEKNVIFGGRLAEYKYYDMAPIIGKLLNQDKENPF